MNLIFNKTKIVALIILNLYLIKQNLNTDNLISNVIEGIENVKGEEINILDLRTIENVACKYFIICTGNSSTQVNAITSSVRKCVSKELSEKPWHIEGLENCKWVLMDYVDVVVHVFNKETRDFYKLEELWEEAESTTIETKY